MPTNDTISVLDLADDPVPWPAGVSASQAGRYRVTRAQPGVVSFSTVRKCDIVVLNTLADFTRADVALQLAVVGLGIKVVGRSQIQDGQPLLRTPGIVRHRPAISDAHVVVMSGAFNAKHRKVVSCLSALARVDGSRWEVRMATLSEEASHARLTTASSSYLGAAADAAGLAQRVRRVIPEGLAYGGRGPRPRPL